MNNNIELQDYIIGNQIGKGQYGTVHECQHKNKPNLRLCVKKMVLQKDPDKLKKQEREVDIMWNLSQEGVRNENIVKLEHVEIKQEIIFIVMERCDGSLHGLLAKREKLPTIEALEAVRQIVNGYSVLLNRNIIHRDIKPQNIMYTGNVFKIADFGLARIMDCDPEKFSRNGTPAYAAPQLFHEKSYTNQADVYSLGITLYELIYGFQQHPYPSKTIQDIVISTKQLKTVPLKLEQRPGITEDVTTLIESMLKYHEDQRIKWQELLVHPLLKQKNNKIKIVVQSQNLSQSCPQQTSVIQQAQQSQSQRGQSTTDQVYASSITGSTSQTSQTQQLFPQQQQLQQQQNNQNSTQALFQLTQLSTSTQDQYYQIGLLYSIQTDLTFQFASQLKPKIPEIMSIKMYLIYLAQSFFQQFQSIANLQPYQTGLYPLYQSENQLQKLFQQQQVLAQEMGQDNFQYQRQVNQLNLTPFDAQFHLIMQYRQAKEIFSYSPVGIYSTDYLILLIIFEKMKEIAQLQQNFDFSNFYMSVLQVQKSNESNIKAYLSIRRRCQ